MIAKAALGAAVLLLAAGPATAFNVDEFRNGISRERVQELLSTWRFDRVQEFSENTLIAYDLPEKNSNRQFRFTFCNDKLVALEQAMKPSTRNFVTIVSNYLQTYGQPVKVDAGHSVLSSGEKSALAINWRRNNEIIGLRYLLLPGGEELTVVYEVPNTCFQTPRAP